MPANTIERPTLREPEAIGDQYFAVATEQNDGFLHRTAGLNSLFYAKDFALARHLLTQLTQVGPETMRQTVPADSALKAPWTEMTRAGFFADSDSPSPLTIGWRFDRGFDPDDPRAADAYRAAFEVFGISFPRIHIVEPEADRLAGLASAVSAYAMRLAQPPVEDNRDSAPSVIAYSALAGEPDDHEPLIDWL
ncbi:MAG: hypothetical protein AAF333_11560 [Planctomycetota bacterium]